MRYVDELESLSGATAGQIVVKGLGEYHRI